MRPVSSSRGPWGWVSSLAGRRGTELKRGDWALDPGRGLGSLRFSGLPREGAASARRDAACQFLRARGWRPQTLVAPFVREERAPVRRLPPGSLCSLRSLGSHPHDPPVSQESPPAGSPPGRGCQAGAPLVPPTHGQHRVLVVSARAPTRSRLAPAGDSVCLPHARGAQPIGVAQVMFMLVGLL